MPRRIPTLCADSGGGPPRYGQVFYLIPNTDSLTPVPGGSLPNKVALRALYTDALRRGGTEVPRYHQVFYLIPKTDSRSNAGKRCFLFLMRTAGSETFRRSRNISLRRQAEYHSPQANITFLRSKKISLPPKAALRRYKCNFTPGNGASRRGGTEVPRYRREFFLVQKTDGR